MNSSTATRASVARADGWVVAPPRPDPPAVRLFCLPYVGGAASVYAAWDGAFGEHVEVCPIELPGHWARLRETAFTGLDPLVDALASALVDELDVPYALFGHSMGSLLAFELARELRRRHAREPVALFVSGGQGPRLPRRRPPLHDASDEQIVARLRAIGGLPDEISEEPELLRRVMPTLRADFAVCETYEYRAGRPLDCPVVAFAGRDDHEVPPARVASWLEETTGRFDYHVLPGGHFFVRTEQAAVFDMIQGRLSGTVRSAGRHAS